MGIGTEIQAIIGHSWTSVENTAVTGKFVLCQLFEFRFGFNNKCTGISANRNNFSINLSLIHI